MIIAMYGIQHHWVARNSAYDSIFIFGLLDWYRIDGVRASMWAIISVP